MQRTFLEAHRIAGYFWSLVFGEAGKEGDFYFQLSTPPYVQKPFLVQWTYITYIIRQQQQHRVAVPSKTYTQQVLGATKQSTRSNSRMFQITLVGSNCSVFWTLISFFSFPAFSFPSLLSPPLSSPSFLPPLLLQIFIEMLLWVSQIIQYCIIIKFGCMR